MATTWFKLGLTCLRNKHNKIFSFAVQASFCQVAGALEDLGGTQDQQLSDRQNRLAASYQNEPDQTLRTELKVLMLEFDR